MVQAGELPDGDVCRHQPQPASDCEAGQIGLELAKDASW